MVLSSIVEGARSIVTPFIQPLFVTFLYFTINSLGTMINVWSTGDRIQDENDLPNPLQPKPYDFIIVGAGSAGCLLANRLSESYSVLLLEAGGEPNPMQFIPGFSLFFAGFPELDWQYRTVPQTRGTLISVNGESSWSVGRELGGTGTLNYLIHLRGHKNDFDNWANLTGDPSWSWNGVLPFFKSYEDYEIAGDNVNHGYGGDLRIEEPPDLPQTARDFVNGGAELGYPNVDLNAPFKEGFDIIRFSMNRGVRQAPYKAFLEPIRFRNTLTIMKFAQVNKILFNSENVAYGVEYDRHGRTYLAQATREVIVSAGTVGSPKLLMLSGIGPKEHLDSLNIPVLSDLPVGRNLQDHLGVYLAPFFIRTGAGFYLDRDLTIGEFIKWFTLGRGRLSNPGPEATGVFSSSFAKARGEGDWPDIQLFSYGFTMFDGGPGQLARIFNLKQDELEQYNKNDVGRDSLYIIVTAARPVSRGYIELGGSSPYDRPIIDPNYLGDPEEMDLKVLLEAVKTTLYLMENTTALGVNLEARFTSARLPGCEHLEFRSDEYWICFIRRYSLSLHHSVGTVSMGSVVDTQLRVLGTRNLRVIDASVQPVNVVASTQASTLMIAEKGADMVLKTWNVNGNKNNNKNKPFLSLFGLGEGGSGGSNNFFWNNINFNKANRTDNKDRKPNLKNVWLGQDAPLPLTVVPTRHTIPSNEISEQVTRQKLEQSLRDLQVMGEMVRQTYDVQFKRDNVAYNPPPPKTTTTPTPTSWGSSSSRGNRNNNKNVGAINTYESKENVAEEDYYYDEDEKDNSSQYKESKRAPPPPQKSTPQVILNYQYEQQPNGNGVINRPKNYPSGDNNNYRNSLDEISNYSGDQQPYQNGFL